LQNIFFCLPPWVHFLRAVIKSCNENYLKDQNLLKFFIRTLKNKYEIEKEKVNVIKINHLSKMC
jgi:hypothetical protein